MSSKSIVKSDAESSERVVIERANGCDYLWIGRERPSLQQEFLGTFTSRPKLKKLRRLIDECLAAKENK